MTTSNGQGKRQLVHSSIKGPRTAGIPALILITKMIEAQLRVRTSYPPNETRPLSEPLFFFKRFRVPLTRPGQAKDTTEFSPPNPPDDELGQPTCVRASIGISFDGSFLEK